eukprot:6190849-Pleurochrysis_carterae.AAC.1
MMKSFCVWGVRIVATEVRGSDQNGLEGRYLVIYYGGNVACAHLSRARTMAPGTGLVASGILLPGGGAEYEWTDGGIRGRYPARSSYEGDSVAGRVAGKRMRSPEIWDRVFLARGFPVSKKNIGNLV